ncbi:MAG: LysR family transcriptional regulator [Gammaproteobacteria bacterium]|nr:LysR family transcriptional regulator [Gammaproteobacteria bacterium]
MDKLRAMQTFVRIVDDGSLTAAARSLNSSLPAVVRTLAALEEHLCVRLLNRTTRRLSLTAEGKTYLGRCRSILAEVTETEEALTSDRTEPSGMLRITAPVLFGQIYVAPAVTRFVQRYDKLRCSLILLDHVVNLLEQQIDVGIRIGPLVDSSLVAQQISEIRRVVVASPSYLRKHGTPKHPKELARANCVCFAGVAGQSWAFQDGPRKLTVPVSGNLDFNQSTPAIAACAEGAGFGMFLSYQVAPYVAQKRLRIVLEEFETPPIPLSVIYPHARLLPSRTRVFVEWIKKELKSMLPKER